MLDPLKLVKPEKRAGDPREWYVADPAVVYPAVIAVIRDGNPAWDDALKPRKQFTDPVKIAARALCLEKARLCFTELLHRALAGKPLCLHILRGDGHFRL